jgi:hypothetical protein
VGSLFKLGIPDKEEVLKRKKIWLAPKNFFLLSSFHFY